MSKSNNIISNNNLQKENNVNGIDFIQEQLPDIDSFFEERANKYERLIDILHLRNTYLIERTKNGRIIYDILMLDKKGNVKFRSFSKYIPRLFLYFNNVIGNFVKVDKVFAEYMTTIKKQQDLQRILEEYFYEKELVIQESDLIFDIDFRQEEKVKVKEIFLENAGRKIIKIIYNNIDFYLEDNPEFHNKAIWTSKMKYYLKLYKKVFPDFTEYLNLLALNLFDTGRKTSFVYINTPSNWGKSFLAALFVELGIGLKVLPESLTKRPSGLVPENFKNKVNLIIDEFRVFKHSFKDLTDNINLEAKNRSEVNIPLFLKTFLSAEYSVSFTDAADNQIINRIVMYKYDENEVELLDKLIDKYKLDKNELKTYLKFFIAKYLSKRIEYIKKYYTTEMITEKIKIVFEKRKLDIKDLRIKLIELFLNFIREFIAEAKEETIKMGGEFSYPALFKYPYSKNKHFYLYFKNEKIVRVSSLKSILGYIIEREDEDTQAKLNYKLKDVNFLNRLFNVIPIKTKIKEGYNIDMYEINLEFLEKKLENIKDNKEKREEIDLIKFLNKEIEQLKEQNELLVNEIEQLKSQVKQLELDKGILIEDLEQERKEKESLLEQLNKLYQNDDNNANDNLDFFDIPF